VSEHVAGGVTNACLPPRGASRCRERRRLVARCDRAPRHTRARRSPRPCRGAADPAEARSLRSASVRKLSPGQSSVLVRAPRRPGLSALSPTCAGRRRTAHGVSPVRTLVSRPGARYDATELSGLPARGPGVPLLGYLTGALEKARPIRRRSVPTHRLTSGIVAASAAGSERLLRTANASTRGSASSRRSPSPRLPRLSKSSVRSVRGGGGEMSGRGNYPVPTLQSFVDTGVRCEPGLAVSAREAAGNEAAVCVLVIAILWRARRAQRARALRFGRRALHTRPGCWGRGRGRIAGFRAGEREVRRSDRRSAWPLGPLRSNSRSSPSGGLAREVHAPQSLLGDASSSAIRHPGAGVVAAPAAGGTRPPDGANTAPIDLDLLFDTFRAALPRALADQPPSSAGLTAWEDLTRSSRERSTLAQAREWLASQRGRSRSAAGDRGTDARLAVARGRPSLLDRFIGKLASERAIRPPPGQHWARASPACRPARSWPAGAPALDALPPALPVLRTPSERSREPPSRRRLGPARSASRPRLPVRRRHRRPRSSVPAVRSR